MDTEEHVLEHNHDVCVWGGGECTMEHISPTPVRCEAVLELQDMQQSLSSSEAWLPQVGWRHLSSFVIPGLRGCRAALGVILRRLWVLPAWLPSAAT